LASDSAATWIPETSVQQRGPPRVPLLLAVLMHFLAHLHKAALWIDSHLLRYPVEQPRHHLVAPERVLNYAPGAQQADIARGIDDLVHERHIG